MYATLKYADGLSAQVSVNWSDESYRKMTTRITAWGTAGRVYADRQECQVYLRDAPSLPAGYKAGWNVRYTTELTEPVRFYVRGEEDSAQLDHWVGAIRDGRGTSENDFASAAQADRTVAMMIGDAEASAAPKPPRGDALPRGARPPRRGGWRVALAGLAGR